MSFANTMSGSGDILTSPLRVTNSSDVEAPLVGATAAASPTISKQTDTLHVVYLVNQYPKVSHSFIRREIHALERQGVRVDRIALRGWDADVVDPADIDEKNRTQYTLRNGLLPLAAAALKTCFTRPKAFAQALFAALAMGRKSDKALPYHLVYLAHACRIYSWVVQSGATHIHAHFGTNSAEVALLVRRLGGPEYSFTVHGADEADRGQFLALDRKISSAKFVVAISSYTRSQLFRRCASQDWRKIKLIHCGLDAGFYENSAPAAPEGTTLVCVGRLSEEKGQLILIDALARVLPQREDCQLVLAGDGDMRQQIEQKIRALGIERHVRITGWITSDQVRNEILNARALVLPSFQEGLPVVIMEAMALRRPVISTYVAGIPELVEPGQTGWLVPAGNVAELAQVIETCLETSAPILQQMGDNAHSRVVERHSIDREATKLAQLFSQTAISDEIEEWQP